MSEINANSFAVYDRVKELVDKEGIDWVYMGKAGAGTGVGEELTDALVELAKSLK